MIFSCCFVFLATPATHPSALRLHRALARSLLDSHHGMVTSDIDDGIEFEQCVTVHH